MELITNDRRGGKPTKVRTRRQMLATGFASPADNYVEKRLDINDYVVKNPTSTFYFRLTSDFGRESQLQKGDLIIVDRSGMARRNSLAIATVDGEFLPILLRKNGERYVARDLRKNKDIETDWSFWGIITYILRPLV